MNQQICQMHYWILQPLNLMFLLRKLIILTIESHYCGKNYHQLMLQKKLKDVTTNCKDLRKEVIDISRKLTPRETKLLTKIRQEYNHYRSNLDACNQALRYINME